MSDQKNVVFLVSPFVKSIEIVRKPLEKVEPAMKELQILIRGLIPEITGTLVIFPGLSTSTYA